MKRTLFPSCLMAVCAITSTTVADGQADSSERKNRSQQQQDHQRKTRQDGQSTDAQQKQSQQGTRHETRRMSGDLRTLIRPEGWVQIGIDSNSDGRVDAWRTIYAYDLMTAHRQSQQRQQNQKQQKQASHHAARRQHQVQGTVQNMRSISLQGMNGRNFKIARVKTQDNRTARVLLGAEQDLQKLNLKEGDQISVTGHPGRVNDRVMLIASRVQSENQSVDVTMQGMTQRRDMRRVRGDLHNLHERKFQGRDQTFMVANIDLGNGSQRPIVLGPKSKASQLNLKSGDQISAVVCQGKLNGKTALVAKQLRAHGESISISKSPHGDDTSSSNRNPKQRDR